MDLLKREVLKYILNEIDTCPTDSMVIDRKENHLMVNCNVHRLSPLGYAVRDHIYKQMDSGVYNAISGEADISAEGPYHHLFFQKHGRDLKSSAIIMCGTRADSEWFYTSTGSVYKN